MPEDGPWEIPPLPEGSPRAQPLAEDAPHFLIRQVRAHPGQVTIYAAGPLTNIALAVAIDPRFAELTRGIVIMGSSLNPHTDDPEFATSPRHEFNFWFDPEAARIVLRARWPRIDVTTVDVSIKAMFTQEMLDAISQSSSPAAQYIARFAKQRYYLWDELAACAWLDPAIITKVRGGPASRRDPDFSLRSSSRSLRRSRRGTLVVPNVLPTRRRPDAAGLREWFQRVSRYAGWRSRCETRGAPRSRAGSGPPAMTIWVPVLPTGV